jgi:hypothetical protein
MAGDHASAFAPANAARLTKSIAHHKPGKASRRELVKD